MRILLTCAALAILTTPALAAQASQNADLYAQRRALLAADDGCALLAEGPRLALAAMTAQSRAALVREGWRVPALAELERKAVAAGRARTCADPALRQAVASAKAGYDGWRRLSLMRFPGAETSWTARRTPDPDGWILWQDAPGKGGRFGVRQVDQRIELTFAAPHAIAASGARLRLRDLTRAPQPGFDAPGRAKASLADRAPMPVESIAVLAGQKRLEPAASARPPQAAFTFDLAVLNRLEALDTREAVRIELPRADGSLDVVHIEVGDLAAARAFVALR